MQRPELEKLIKIYLKAETDIINEIGRLRALGFADYHVVAALQRVQGILKALRSDSWEYVPKMIEREFYVAHPELRRPEMYLTPAQHLIAYNNAYSMTAEQLVIAERLTLNLMKEIEDSTEVVTQSLEEALLGRRENDIFRRVGNHLVAESQATGSSRGTVKEFVEIMQTQGVTAFVDKAGRSWRLSSYASMATRSTDRQAQVLAVVTKDTEQDLFQITSHSTSCGVCAPYEGRVYSKSGKDKRFPPLASAFGKIDPMGPNTLENTWLNIHPNCLHSIVAWTEAGRSKEEVQKMIDFSDPAKNPFSVDPRSEKEIRRYKEKEDGRRKYLEAKRQWERYRVTIPKQTPKTFATFMKHKVAGDDTYKAWVKEYRAENRRLKDEADTAPD
jgi:hypothetical protein